MSRRSIRWATGLAVGAVCLAASTSLASAHDLGHGGGTSVGLALVVGLPVVTGLLGGVAAVGLGRRARRHGQRRPVELGLAVLLVGLGATSVLAATPDWLLGAVGGAVLGLGAGVWLHRDAACGASVESGHARLATGSVCAHRAVEGLLVGALYSAGAALGLAAVLALAGHTALESAAVAGLFGRRRRSAAAAVGLVQAGHVVGAAAGVLVATGVSPAARTVVLGLVGGVLLAAGMTELHHALGQRGRAGLLPGGGERPDPDAD